MVLTSPQLLRVWLCPQKSQDCIKQHLRMQLPSQNKWSAARTLSCTTTSQAGPLISKSKAAQNLSVAQLMRNARATQTGPGGPSVQIAPTAHMSNGSPHGTTVTPSINVFIVIMTLDGPWLTSIGVPGTLQRHRVSPFSPAQSLCSS